MSKRKLSYDEAQPTEAKRVHHHTMTSSFRVAPADSYKGGFPTYAQPREINSYSIDGDRRVWFDDRELVRL